MSRLRSFSEVAAELDIDRRAMPLVVKACGIEPKPIPHNGNAKGLTPADVRRLRRMLRLDEKQVS